MELSTGNAKDSETRLLNFVKTNVLEGILDTFTETTGLMANLVDSNGKPILPRSKAERNCKFCRIIHNMEGGLARCQGACKRAGQQAAMFGESYVFRCPSGLIEWAAPIVVEGQHLGSLICGQVLMWQPGDFFWIELREMNKELTNDFTELFRAVDELPIVSPNWVKSASHLMFIIANYIAKSGWEGSLHAQEMIQQQSRLYKEIESRKGLENRLEAKVPPAIGRSQENELLAKVRMGDDGEARELFQKLLAGIVLEESDLSATQARVIELCVLVSRSAMDMGVPQQSISAENGQAFQRILAETTSEGVCLQGQRLLDRHLAAIHAMYAQPNNTKVKEIKRYIQQNFAKDLTLEDIASSVYLSPSYASRLFKKVQSRSIMDYLTHVRMEEAKRLLENPQYLIDEIAHNVGYPDASYFSKVFRRYAGVTPSLYRKNVQS